ncbi:MAG TPA: DUF6677 family protein [Vicinamibacterales bacterium]|nr:DUF6677 family protein [Vicinamibacterales bacterium]
MRPNPLSVGIAGWLVPGAGHLLAGAARKGVIFFIVLNFMFAIGLIFRGELFAFDPSDWLVFLAALAQWAIGIPHILAGMMGGGHGEVTAATYEYGNTFLIVGGLLNALVVLDALDTARGVTRR